MGKPRQHIDVLSRPAACDVQRSRGDNATSTRARTTIAAPSGKTVCPLAFLRDQEYFKQMKARLQQGGAAALPAVLQEIKSSDLQLLYLISDNIDAFTALVNEPDLPEPMAVECVDVTLPHSPILYRDQEHRELVPTPKTILIPCPPAFLAQESPDDATAQDSSIVGPLDAGSFTPLTPPPSHANLSVNKLTFEAARDKCAAKSGDPVSIHDAAESAFVQTLINEGPCSRASVATDAPSAPTYSCSRAPTAPQNQGGLHSDVPHPVAVLRGRVRRIATVGDLLGYFSLRRRQSYASHGDVKPGGTAPSPLLTVPDQPGGSTASNPGMGATQPQQQQQRQRLRIRFCGNTPVRGASVNPQTGQADYSAQWAEYYRGMGMVQEAEAEAAKGAGPSKGHQYRGLRGRSAARGLPSHQQQQLRQSRQQQQQPAVLCQQRHLGARPKDHFSLYQYTCDYG